MIRTFNICRQLRRLGHVTFAAVENRVNEQSIAAAKELSDQFELFNIMDYRRFPRFLGDLIQQYHMNWPGIVGFRVSRYEKKKFLNLLKEHDLVWFHTISSAIPLMPMPKYPCVMDLDDLMHVKLQLQSRQDIPVRFKLSARVQAFKWRRIELAAPAHHTNVTVCSEQDRCILGSPTNVCVVPNGFTVPSVKPQWSPTHGLRIGFIGTLDYPPNLEGLKWFAQRVWPLIGQVRPDIRFRIVGALSRRTAFLSTISGFEPLGYVEDPGPEFKTWTAMIVPLFAGGGTRIKILEAFSRLCPVVSTSVGAYGLDVEDQKNILLADLPQDFAKQCLTLCEKPQLGLMLAQEGWTLFTQKYTWEQIGHTIHRVVKKCLEVR